MNQSAKRYLTKAGKNGFTLVEVMVALVVLSIGLLGIAAMQLQGLKNAHSSYQRTIASIIAMDAAERLWLKLTEADDTSGEINDDDVTEVQDAWIAAWNSTRTPAVADNAIGLPLDDTGACGDVNASRTCISKNGNQYTIWVVWRENRFTVEDDASTAIDERTESSFSYVMNLLP